jgi:hypothetical protein
MIDEHDPRILEAKARDFLHNIRPDQYKQMSKADINEYCEIKAKSAIQYAKNLMTCGVSEPEAWNLAIRSCILESESD